MIGEVPLLACNSLSGTASQFMLAWTWPRIVRYCQSKGWQVEQMPNDGVS